MAKFVATDYKVTVNGTNLSSSLTSVDLSLSADEVDTTTFGGEWRTVTGGLKSGSITLNFNQDFAASSVEATIYALLGTTATVVVKPVSSTVTATNPSYSMSVLCTEWTPLDAQVGELASASITWPVDGAITKAVA